MRSVTIGNLQLTGANFNLCVHLGEGKGLFFSLRSISKKKFDDCIKTLTIMQAATEQFVNWKKSELRARKKGSGQTQ